MVTTSSGIDAAAWAAPAPVSCVTRSSLRALGNAPDRAHRRYPTDAAAGRGGACPRGRSLPRPVRATARSSSAGPRGRTRATPGRPAPSAARRRSNGSPRGPAPGDNARVLVHPWDAPLDDDEVVGFVRAQGFGHLVVPGRREVPVVVPTQFVFGDAGAVFPD